MTIQTVPLFSPFSPVNYLGGSSGNVTLDTTDDWVAWLFRWPGGDLTKCAFYTVTATGSPVVTAQLFNVDPTDAGTSPVNVGSAIGSAVDSATLVTATPRTITGIGQAALAAGVYALRLIFKSGTSCVIKKFTNSEGPWGGLLPYTVTVANGGAQTKDNSQSSVALAIGGSVFVPIPGLHPPCLLGNTSVNSGTTNDEYGLWTSYPVGVRVAGLAVFKGGATCPDLRGAFYSGSLASPSQDQTAVIDRDTVGTSPAAWATMLFDTPQVVAANATFGVAVRANTTENIGFYYWDFLTGNEVIMDAWWGQNATLFTRENNAGVLTPTTFRTPLVYPILNGIDDGGGGSQVPLSRPTIFWE